MKITERKLRELIKEEIDKDEYADKIIRIVGLLEDLLHSDMGEDMRRRQILKAHKILEPLAAATFSDW